MNSFILILMSKIIFSTAEVERFPQQNQTILVGYLTTIAISTKSTSRVTIVELFFIAIYQISISPERDNPQEPTCFEPGNSKLIDFNSLNDRFWSKRSIFYAVMISSTLMSDASQSKISYTVILRFRIQVLPPFFPFSAVIIFCIDDSGYIFFEKDFLTNSIF